MTSREHARRLMLILLASEGTTLRQAADERMQHRREQPRSTRTGIRTTDNFSAGFIASGQIAPRSSEAVS